MNIVIDHDGVRREIDGPFHIRGSVEDLMTLRDAINLNIQNITDDNRDFLAWVEVDGGQALYNQPSKTWEEAGK